jgi:hypothetical protein
VNQSWEYSVETLGNIWRGPSPEDIELLLNEAASDGWELVTVFGQSSGGNRLTVVLRRERRTTSRRRRDTWP